MKRNDFFRLVLEPLCSGTFILHFMLFVIFASVFAAGWGIPLPEKMPGRAEAALRGFPMIFWLALVFNGSMALFDQTAQGDTKLKNWSPTSLDFVGEKNALSHFFIDGYSCSLCFILLLTSSTVPGGLLYLLFHASFPGIPLWGSLSVSAALLGPIFVLSGAINKCPFDPINLEVYQTFKKAWRSWLIFYLCETILLFAGLVLGRLLLGLGMKADAQIAASLTTCRSSFSVTALCLTITLMLPWYAHLLGVLSLKISPFVTPCERD